MEKLNFQQSLLQSWMLHDPSEIILILYADLLLKKHYCHECQKVAKYAPPPQVCFDEKRVLKNLKFEICYTFWSVSNWLNKEHKLLNRNIDKHTIAGFDLFYASLSQWPCHSVVLELCAYFMLFCCSFMACNLFCFLFCLVLKASFTN